MDLKVLNSAPTQVVLTLDEITTRFDAGGGDAFDALLLERGHAGLMHRGRGVCAAPRADSPATDLRPLLHWAAALSHPRLLRHMHAQGAALDEEDTDGEQALHVACRAGALQCARALILLGAEIDAPDAKGRTPLMHAVQQHRSEICAMLHHCGAQLNATDDEGRTALHWAAYVGDEPLATWLLEQSTTLPTATDSRHSNPLHYAAKSGSHAALAAIDALLRESDAAAAMLKQRNADGDVPRECARREARRVTRDVASLEETWAGAHGRAGRRRAFVLKQTVRSLKRAAARLEDAEDALKPLRSWRRRAIELWARLLPIARKHLLWSLLLLCVVVTVREYARTEMLAATGHWTLLTAFTWFTTVLTWVLLHHLFIADPGFILRSSGAPNLSVVPSAGKYQCEYATVLEEGVEGAHVDLSNAIRRPLRSKHDSHSGSNLVIARFSHHCGFTALPIGQGNHREFILTITCAWVMSICWIALLLAYAHTLSATLHSNDWIDTVAAFQIVAPLRWFVTTLPNELLPRLLPFGVGRFLSETVWSAGVLPAAYGLRAHKQWFFALLFPWINVQHFLGREVLVHWGAAAVGLTPNEVYALHGVFALGQSKPFYAYLYELAAGSEKGVRKQFIAVWKKNLFSRGVCGNIRIMLRIDPPAWPAVDAARFAAQRTTAREAAGAYVINNSN